MTSSDMHDSADGRRLARRRGLFWRIHFCAARSGIPYVFTPQIESGLYGGLDRAAAVGGMG